MEFNGCAHEFHDGDHDAHLNVFLAKSEMIRLLMGLCGEMKYPKKGLLKSC